MSEIQPQPQPQQVARLFEQPPDAPTFYADLVQIFGTGNEVVLQFYESTPGPPGASGGIEIVRSRLKATAVVSMVHARNIGTLLLQQSGSAEAPTQAGSGPPQQASDAPQGENAQ